MVENASTARQSRSTSQAACPVALRSNNRQQWSHARHLPKSALALSVATPESQVARRLEGGLSAPQPSPVSAPACVGVDMPLAEAVKSAEELDIKALLDAAREDGQLGNVLDERNLRRQAPLHIAAESGRCGVVQLLLDYGASVNIVDSRGETALHRAGAGGHASSVQLLLEHGALVLSDKQGQTALHRAAGRGHATAVAVMLRHTEPWFKTFAESFDRGESEGGSTPLHIAIGGGHADVVKAIMAGFAHDREKLESVTRASNRWGDVPVAVVEGQVPIILTACVRETHRQRKEAHQLMQKRGGDGVEDRRWCELPATPKLPSSLQRKMEKDARKRTEEAFEAVQQELRGRNKLPVHADRATMEGEGREDGRAEHAGEWQQEDDGCRTPATICKTVMNFKLLSDGGVDLDCVYQREEHAVDSMRTGPPCTGTQPEDNGGETGDMEERDILSADCEFEFNFDLMDMCWDSESEEELDEDGKG